MLGRPTLLVFHLLDVRTGRKVLLPTGQDDSSDALILVGLCELLVELVEQGRGEGVESFRSVEGEDRDVVVVGTRGENEGLCGSGHEAEEWFGCPEKSGRPGVHGWEWRLVVWSGFGERRYRLICAVMVSGTVPSRSTA
jgi:hypothetical protein